MTRSVVELEAAFKALPGKPLLPQLDDDMVSCRYLVDDVL
jgi:hypothetical protein